VAEENGVSSLFCTFFFALWQKIVLSLSGKAITINFLPGRIEGWPCRVIECLWEKEMMNLLALLFYRLSSIYCVGGAAKLAGPIASVGDIWREWGVAVGAGALSAKVNPPKLSSATAAITDANIHGGCH